MAGGPEIYGRSGFDYFFSGEETGLDDKEAEKNDNLQPGDWQLFNRVRNQDIRLLKTLNVGAIIDFMVEKKKVKFGVKYVNCSVFQTEYISWQLPLEFCDIVFLSYPKLLTESHPQKKSTRKADIRISPSYRSHIQGVNFSKITGIMTMRLLV